MEREKEDVGLLTSNGNFSSLWGSPDFSPLPSASKPPSPAHPPYPSQVISDSLDHCCGGPLAGRTLLGETLVRETLTAGSNSERTQRIASPPTPSPPPHSSPPEPALITEPGPFSDCPPPLEPRTEAPVPARSVQRKERGCQLGHSHFRGPVPAHWAPSRTLTTPPATAKLGQPAPSP